MNKFSHAKMFKEIPEEMLLKYVATCPMSTFNKKEIAFTPYSSMQSIYLVLKGRIRVSLSYPNGKEFTIAILEKGDVYSGHARGIGVTLEQTEVAYLPMSVFQEMIKEYPDFALNVLGAVGSTLQASFNIIEDLVFRDAHERFYSIILSMADTKGISINDGIEIPLGLTQEELATLIGSTRQTVNSILTHLQKEKIISLRKKVMVIHDRKKLESYIDVYE